MHKRLYLDRSHLDSLFKAKEQTGEHKGGNHAARIQIGVEKDGSPEYRYFTTQAEYHEWLKKRAEERMKKPSSKISRGTHGNKKRKEALQQKLKQEQAQSSKYARTNPSDKVSQQHSKNRSVFSGHTASVKKFKPKLKKSMSLYIGEK